MKKNHIFIILLCLLVPSFPGVLEAKEPDKVNRTIAIFPITNLSKTAENSDIGIIVRDLLRIKFAENENLYQLQYDIIDEATRELDIDVLQVTSSNKLKSIVLTAGADSFLFGSYLVNDGTIEIMIQVYDVISNTIIINEKQSWQIKEDLADAINKFCLEIAQSIFEQLTPVHGHIVRNVMEDLIVIEESDMNIINRLLQQKALYQRKIVIRKLQKRTLAIPLHKFIVIVVSDKVDTFDVTVADKTYTAKDGIKVLFFQNQPDKEYDINVSVSSTLTTMKYKVKQERIHQVKVLKVENEYSYYVRLGGSVSSLLYTGLDARVGFRLPVSLIWDNTLYFRAHFGLNVNVNQTINDGIIHEPHMKCKFGFGYEQVYYFKNFVGIHAGLEVGGMFFLQNYIIQTSVQNKIDSSQYDFAYPGLYVSFPFAVELFAKKKTSLVIGFEPTLRIIFNYFYFNGGWYQNDARTELDNYEMTRGYGADWWWRQQVGITTLELFLYDIPLTVAAKIKI